MAPSVSLLVVVVAAVVATVAAQGQLNVNSELNAIPFHALIGTPLSAIVQAQAMSARTTIDFLNQVAFTSDSTTGQKNAVMFAFHYDTVDANGATRSASISVPLLCMVPIPYLEVTSATIAFNMKLASQEKYTADSSSASSSSSNQAWGNSYQSRGSTASQSQSHVDGQAQREYGYSFTVTVSQAAFPEGTQLLMEKLLGSVQGNSASASSS